MINTSENNRGIAHLIPIIIVGVIVLIIFVLATGDFKFSASINQPETSSLESNIFEGSGISLTYPSDWNQSDTPTGYIAAFSSPREDANDTFSENINIKSIDISSQPNATVTQIADLWLAQTSSEYSTEDFQILNRSSSIMSGLSAEQFVYLITDGDINGKGMTVVTIKNTNAYLVTFTAESPASYDKFIDAVNSILSSLEIN